jgi:uncharacterized membrane protein YccC
MRRKIFTAGISVLLLTFLISISSCGADPKSLAKQSYDIGLEALSALFDPAKAAELEKEITDIEEKVAALSESDRAVYDEELARLSGEGLGSLFGAGAEALQESFDAASSILNDTSAEDIQDSLESLNQALDASQQALDLYNSVDVDEAVDAAQQALDLYNSIDVDEAARQAAEATQQASDLLKSFGF